MRTPEELRTKADEALRAGRITQAERDFYLERALGTATRHHHERRDGVKRRAVAVSLSLTIILSLLWLLTTQGTGPTGLVVNGTPLANMSPNATANSAPIQTAPLPTITLTVGEETSLNLDAYFQDPDGDALSYDALNAAGATVTVAGSTLTVAGTRAGETSTYVFANDAETLIQSDEVLITVTANATNTTSSDPTNATLTDTSGTLNDTNATATNNTTNATNGSEPAAGNESNATVEPEGKATPTTEPAAEDVTGTLLTAADGTVLGRFTELGNLLVRGAVVERSTTEPAPGDYAVGRALWISAATGDLHVGGNVHEEEPALTPPPGAYGFASENGIVVGYLDGDGDLHVAGNVIPRRSSIA